MNDAILLLPCELKKQKEERKIIKEARMNMSCPEREKGLAEKPKPLVIKL